MAPGLLLLRLAFLQSPVRRREIARVLTLSLLVAAIWCWHNDRLTWANWSLPLDYSGDSLEILARIQAAAEGDLVPFHAHVIHRLGAPFDANWNEYPGSDDLANFGLGLVARVVGVPATSNLALLLAHLTAAWAFYLCARLLRHRWEWAFAGALLFSLSYFGLARSLPHLWLTFTGTVPLAVLTCGLVAAGRRVATRPAWRWLCYGTAVLLGASNPYNLFLFLQLLAWSVLAQWLRARWSAGVRLGLACGIIAVVMFAAVHAYIALNVIDDGGTPLLVRNYAGTEIYGLKPIELFLPSSRHHSAWLAAVGHRYVRWTDWRGETFSPYLGFVGAVGLVWMVVALVGGLLAGARHRLPKQALPAMWILLFSAIGGVNSILAFYFSLYIFRASNRYSIFLLALSLLFIVARLTRLTRTWRPAARLGFAGLVAIIGVWDQLPARRSAEIRREIADRVAADRRLGGELERRLSPRAMIFQLPMLDFPEGVPQLRVNEYDHFRPFLFTRTAQFSYGESKNRARGAWQRDVPGMTPANLVRTLEGCGFAALYINRHGYADNGAQLLADLAAAGRAEIIGDSSGNQVVVRLQPSAQPRLPLARVLTFGRGWNRRLAGEAGPVVRWTTGSASLSYYNPFPHPLRATVRLAVSSVGERNLRVMVGGRELTRLRLGVQATQVDLPALDLAPGVNRFDFVTSEPAIRVSEERWKLRALGVQQFQMHLQSEPAIDVGLAPDETRGTADPGAANAPGGA